MAVPLHDDKGAVVPFDTSGLRHGEDALRRQAERQALLLEVASDLMRTSDPGELGRVTFEHIKSAFGAVVCTNYRLDPTGQRLRLAFAHGIPPEKLEAAELDQEYCGTAAASRQHLVADKQRIASDPKAGLMRELGATAYACYPLKASDGRLLGTFTVASATRESFTDDEVAWLGTVTDFLAHAWERFEAEQAQRESKDRLQLALNTAEIGWWQNDPLVGLRTDARLKAIFDFTADEMPSSEEFLKRIHPDDAPRVSARVEVMFDPAATKQYTDEYRIHRRDGELRWVEARAFSYFEGSGRERRVVRFGTIRDITERKQQEERERLLMREVSHRAKNMLNVVDSIARQTAARNPEDFIERFSDRIQALSANQDLLIRNEWKGVDVGDLVGAQLAHFADLIGTRIAMQGRRLRLNPASAQAIGLALHELATNAGKYGALSTDRGHVDIFWESDGDTLTMSWTEHDGPASPPERRGFGTLVMGEMAKRSVGGEVEIHYGPLGVTWRLTCPTANALERR